MKYTGIEKITPRTEKRSANWPNKLKTCYYKKGEHLNVPQRGTTSEKLFVAKTSYGET